MTKYILHRSWILRLMLMVSGVVIVAVLPTSAHAQLIPISLLIPASPVSVTTVTAAPTAPKVPVYIFEDAPPAPVSAPALSSPLPILEPANSPVYIFYDPAYKDMYERETPSPVSEAARQNTESVYDDVAVDSEAETDTALALASALGWTNRGFLQGSEYGSTGIGSADTVAFSLAGLLLIAFGALKSVGVTSGISLLKTYVKK